MLTSEHYGPHYNIRVCEEMLHFSLEPVLSKAPCKILGGIKALIRDLIGILSTQRC